MKCENDGDARSTASVISTPPHLCHLRLSSISLQKVSFHEDRIRRGSGKSDWSLCRPREGQSEKMYRIAAGEMALSESQERSRIRLDYEKVGVHTQVLVDTCPGG
jgi:hypothetical protein